MQINHLNISYAYHFLCESLIIFLIALPIMHYHYFWVPYWSYLIVTAFACIVFTLMTRFVSDYIWYLAVAPVLFILFYVLDYPLVIAIIFPCLLVWRYIDIRKEEIISRENKYILFTLILTALVLLIVRDSIVMLYPFLQFIILITGYIGSNLAVVKKEDRKQFDIKLSFYFFGILVASAGIFYLLFSFFRMSFLKVWDGILWIITGGLNVFSYILSFITIEKKGWSKQETNSSGQGDNEFFNKLEQFNIIDAMTSYWVVALGILFLAIVLFFIITLSKKRFRGSIEELEESVESVSYSSPSDLPKQSDYSKLKGFNNLFKKSKHPIRKMVYQFERKTANTKKGRKKAETLEEWIERNGWNVDLNSYQKVRYGGKNISDQEVEHLKSQLKEVELGLN